MGRSNMIILSGLVHIDLIQPKLSFITLISDNVKPQAAILLAGLDGIVFYNFVELWQVGLVNLNLDDHVYQVALI